MPLPALVVLIAQILCEINWRRFFSSMPWCLFRPCRYLVSSSLHYCLRFCYPFVVVIVVVVGALLSTVRRIVMVGPIRVCRTLHDFSLLYDCMIVVGVLVKV